MRKILLLILLSALFSIGFALAQPSIPHVFSGTVTYSGNPSIDLDGSEVTASFNGAGSSIKGIVSLGNQYEIDIETSSTGGDVVIFIDGIEAFPHINAASFPLGEDTNIDLTIDQLPSGEDFCGNGNIEPWEECDGENIPAISTCESVTGVTGAIGNLHCSSTCYFDISECGFQNTEVPDTSGDDDSSSSSSSSSGGGGGGGGSSSGDLHLNIQSPPSIYNPNEEQPDNTINLNTNANEDQVIHINTEEERQGTLSKITGAVIGAIGTSGALMTIVFIVLVIATLIIVISVRKR